MDLKAAKKEFSEKCLARGFHKKSSGYYRCIGDGIYQTIDLGGRTYYINPQSPWYSRDLRKTRKIDIGLWSIYSRLKENWFDPSDRKGNIDPGNTIGRGSATFWGIQEDYRIMDETGFDFLDSVDSQAKLISAFEQMSLVRPGLKYEIALIIPYLICGNDAEANRLIIHNYENERSIQYFTTTWDGDLKAEDKQRALQYGRELRKATLSEDNLRALMKKNLDTNLSHADKYGLQIREGFQPLV